MSGMILASLMITAQVAVETSLTDYALFPYTYTPAAGGINCDGDCSTVATGEMGPELYGWALACPGELVGYDVTAWVWGPWGYWRPCLDAGGAIVIDHKAGVVYVDAMEHCMERACLPWWSYLEHEEWQIEWRVNPLRGSA
jgi:hypothetical protein